MEEKQKMKAILMWITRMAMILTNSECPPLICLLRFFGVPERMPFPKELACTIVNSLNHPVLEGIQYYPDIEIVYSHQLETWKMEIPFMSTTRMKIMNIKLKKHGLRMLLIAV